MKANIHFNHYQYQDEQSLVQDLHDEVIQILGVNMSYMPKEHFNYDLIFGSDDDQRFNKAYLIEMMMEQTDDYVGNSLLGKFGLQVEETMTLLVSKRRFDETQIPDRARPHEGDLIYMPTDKRIYTITFVDYQAPGFLQAGIFPGFRLSCELYTPSHEQIQTEIKHIDEADKEMYSLDIPVTDIVGRFATNEKVVGSTSGFRGDVYKFYPRKKILSVNHLNGLFTAGETVTGESSGATATVTELVTHIGNKNSEIKSLETNEQLIDESNLIVEWDPNNPLA
jgi:hypothetical protein